MKQALRTALVQIRNEMSSREVQEKSSDIQKKVLSLSAFQQATTIGCYFPYGNEVRTHSIIQQSLKQEKTIGLPACHPTENIFSMYAISSLSDVRVGKHDIMEPQPKKEKFLDPQILDVIIVPGVGFDKQGNRLGHGRAYYDNFLPQTPAIKIGLCYNFQLVKSIPVESHDITMEYVITEDEIIYCNKKAYK